MSVNDNDNALVPPDYKPSETEEYMNPMMVAYFKKKLLDWRKKILAESANTVHMMQEESIDEPDMADRASTETDHSLALRAQDRQRKLIGKIDEALQRIDKEEYGYCEDSGEEIGIARLEARPIAVLSLESQEQHEKKEKTQQDMRV